MGTKDATGVELVDRLLGEVTAGWAALAIDHAADGASCPACGVPAPCEPYRVAVRQLELVTA